MEEIGEVNETIKNSAEAPHLKTKENEHSPQPDNCNVMKLPALFNSQEIEWPEHLLLWRSPESNMETLEGKNLFRCTSSQSGSEPLGTSTLSMNDADVMVEELTLRNYKNLNTFLACSSSSGDETPIRKGLWQNLYKLVGDPREVLPKEPSTLVNREDARNPLQNQFWVQRPLLQKQSHWNNSKVSEPLIGNDDHTVLGTAHTRFPEGIRTRVLPTSGFPQFLVKNTLKGKGIAYRHSGTFDVSKPVTQGLKTQNSERASDNTMIASDTSHGSSAKADDTSLYGAGGGGVVVSGLHYNGRSLREWLKSGCCKISKVERLHIFKQILELVDTSHSQGVALQQLQPSHFMILSLNQVKYVGSFVPQVQMELLESATNQDTYNSDHHLKRKRYLEQGTREFLYASQQNLNEHMIFGSQHYPHGTRGDFRGELVKEIDIGSFSVRNLGCDFRERLKSGEDHKTQNILASPTLSSTAFCQQLTSEIAQLEERWYASPEELSENVPTFSSNIYSLGVLLFEFFCYFESWEVHAAAMSDLRDRILPPNFLSESPKEAGFCLWLLHPEPSSRPKSREILLRDLMCETRDFSSVDHSSASVDEEDAEAELLLHFLVSMKEQKEKQAAKLVEDIGCLGSDIEEVERRHSLRINILSNARDSLTNFDEISDRYLNKETFHSEAISSLSMSSMNEARLMRIIDQLESAYFSMRSKIEQPQTNGAACADKDVLRNRDRCSLIEANSDGWCTNREADCLGDFFDGLCKYARFSKFEVCGTLRNGDVLNSANVICSLSFDRDEDYFAAAGVSKKIKIFEYGALLNNNVDIHYPVIEMSSKSKLSCVCWNGYIKNYLASTDYDGVVQLWDANTGQGFTKYTEHEKRAWCVDFSQVDPIKLASGSDDCSVKLWSINEKNCTSTICNVANVCCVQFSSHSNHFLAFGSADYKIYCYDLRNTRVPWCILAGHGKAVSYVKFVDSETLVSASTDNTLKLWDLNKTSSSGLSASACSLTLNGHTNEKNFVGLSVSDGYIVCGSETNEVYAYYKYLPMPITSHKFGSIDPISGQEISDDNGQFVSSVCWRGKSNTVVAANSSGSIKLLQMV